jgi:hypothetical protein
MKVELYLNETSQPIVYTNVINTYQKGFMFCIYEGKLVHKYPRDKIWRVVETYSREG